MIKQITNVQIHVILSLSLRCSFCILVELKHILSNKNNN